MRISCNGCRVLRRGCSDDCTLRPCLEWLPSPESQANATLFLAKFYGRAGLINLISAAPARLRPEIFNSLLFEACGRIINPVCGSVGLMSSGDWPRCRAAVAAVLSGGELMKRVPKRSAVSPRRVGTRNRRRRSDSAASAEFCVESEAKFTITGWGCVGDGEDFVIDKELVRASSHDSASVETVEPSLVQFDERGAEPGNRLSEAGLELTLGLNPLYNYLGTPIESSRFLIVE